MRNGIFSSWKKNGGSQQKATIWWRNYVQKEQEHSMRDAKNTPTTLTTLEAKAHAYKSVLEHSHRQITNAFVKFLDATQNGINTVPLCVYRQLQNIKAVVNTSLTT